MSSQSTETLFDWGSAGRYEDVAQALHSIAEAVVHLADLAPGERVLDLGCGTGNAALLAAAKGAKVIGVDPSERLIGIAKARGLDSGYDISFLKGVAAALPVEDASVDVVLDVLSLMFVGDQEAVASELARVTAPGGRILWTGWIPEGANFEVVKARGEAARKLGRGSSKYSASGIPSSEWHDLDQMTSLFEPHGFEVTMQERGHRYEGPSAREWLEGTLSVHPTLVLGDNFFRAAGVLAEVNDRSVEILEAANEDPTGFAVTPRYVIGLARRKEG